MKQYDIIVIGGGMMGTASAYYLAKEGLKVALIERGDISSGTVSHTDGYIGYSEKQPGVDSLQGYHSLQLYNEMVDTFDYDFEFQKDKEGNPVGFVYACETEREVEEAKKQAKKIQDQGMEMEAIDGKQIVELEPNIAKDLAGGLWVPKDGVVCPFKVGFAYVEEARRTGNLDVFTQTSVKSIIQDANTKAVTGVVTDRGEFKAPKIVNACGCWAKEIGAMVGLDLPIEPRFGQLTVTEKCGKITQNRLVLEYGYFLTKFFSDFERPIPPLVKKYNICMNITTDVTGNTVVGGCRLFRGYSIKSEYQILQGVAQRAIRYYPMLENINCIRSFAGIRPFSLDHLPIVSDVPEVPGLYIAAGHEGDGITLGPITGKLISQYVTGKPLQFEEAKELHWSRFEHVDIPKLRQEEEDNTRMLESVEI